MKKKGKWIIEKHTKVGWKDLPVDILGMIFERLDRKCLFESAYSVCQWWRAVSRPMLFWTWHTLDFKIFKVKEVDDVHHFMDLLKLILDGLRLKVASICNLIFPEYLYLSDKHLHYIAQRLPQLQRVDMPCSTEMITPLGFSRAIQTWSELRTFSIGSVNSSDYTYIIKEISVNCKDFSCLKIDLNDMGTNQGTTFVLNGHTSLLIANCHPNLGSIGFSRCVLYKSGLRNIMSKCKHLKVVRISECKLASSCKFDSSHSRKGYYILSKYNDERKWHTIRDDDGDAYLSPCSMVNLLWDMEYNAIHRSVPSESFYVNIHH